MRFKILISKVALLISLYNVENYLFGAMEISAGHSLPFYRLHHIRKVKLASTIIDEIREIVVETITLTHFRKLSINHSQLKDEKIRKLCRLTMRK